MAFGAALAATTSAEIAVAPLTAAATPTSSLLKGGGRRAFGAEPVTVAVPAAAITLQPAAAAARAVASTAGVAAPGASTGAPEATRSAVPGVVLEQVSQVPRAWLVPSGPWVPLASDDAPDGSGRLHEIAGDGVMLGRKEACQIQLTSPTVSGVQCTIRFNPSARASAGAAGTVEGVAGPLAGAWELEDRSSNGTFLNGRKVGRGKVVTLKHSDFIKLTKNAGPSLQFHFLLSMPTELPPFLQQAPAQQAADKQPPSPPPQLQPQGMLHEPVTMTPARTAPPALPGLQTPEPHRSAPSAAVAAAAATVKSTSPLAAELQAAVAAAAAAVAKATGATPALREPPAAAAAPAEHQRIANAEGGVTGSLTGRGEKLRELHKTAESSSAKLAFLLEERARLRAALSSGATAQMADGLRTAEEDVLEEAERSRLSAQRSVLEAELSERQQARDRLLADVERAKRSCQAAVADKERLTQELVGIVEDVYRVKGGSEAADIFMEENKQKSMELLDELHWIQQLSPGLEASLVSARFEITTALEEETGYAHRFQKRRAALESLQHMARSLVADMRRHADSLCDTVDGCRTPRSKSRRLKRARGASGAGLHSSGAGLAEAASPQPHVPHLQETLAVSQQHKDLLKRGKENVAPASSPGASLPRSKRRRLWGGGLAVAASPSVSSQKRGGRRGPGFARPLVAGAAVADASGGAALSNAGTVRPHVGVVPLSLEEDTTFALPAAPAVQVTSTRSRHTPPQAAATSTSSTAGPGQRLAGRGRASAIVIEDLATPD